MSIRDRFSMKRKKIEPYDQPSEQEDQHFRILNMIANSPLTVGVTSPGRVIVYAEFDQEELQMRTGLVLPPRGRGR